jgi:hypothetical protein
LPSALWLTLGLAACAKDSTGPGGGGNNNPSVASVAIEGATSTIEVGQQLQLTATARDGSNNVLTGKVFAWTSTNQGVATVAPSGLVIGQTTGTATINATTDGKSGSYAVTVIAPTIPTISAVTPGSLVAGQAATVTGTNFSPSLLNNVVTVGGAAATVTAASATSLTFTVPSTLCVPGSAEVKVTVAGRSSNAIQQPAQATGTQVNVALGQQQLLLNPTDYCLQFGASTASEAYLIGIQSVSESATNITAVTAGVASASSSTAATSVPLPTALPLGLQYSPSPEQIAHQRRWSRQRQAEAELRAAEAKQFQFADFSAARNAMRAPAKTGGLVAASVIPGTVLVGDQIAIRVPDRGRNLCNNFIDINTTVRVVGTRGIWLEDNANPANGYTTADFQTLSTQFDSQIYGNDLTYFGNPSDLDGNSRIVMVVTKEVNRFGILGFVTTADMQPRSACPSSQFGEVFYATAPDASGTFGDAYSRDIALSDAPILFAHEFSHIIQFSNRIALSAPIPTIWELEGQATLAEEVIGHLMTGRQSAQNYGFSIAFTGASSNAEPSNVPWYAGGFIDLALFYGFNAECPSGDTTCLNTRITGAPEECSWLALNNDGPCYHGREVYGVPWSLLRYISDQYGPTYPGGEKELNKKLIAAQTTGFANLAALAGQSIDVVLAQWAAALYVDDRVQGADSRLTFSSWNMKDIADRLRQPAQLVPREKAFNAFTEQGNVRGGSTLYYLLSSSSRGATAFRARGSNESLLPSSVHLFIVRMQ